MADKVKVVLGIIALIIFILAFNILDQAAAFIFAGIVIVLCVVSIAIQHARSKKIGSSSKPQ